MRFELGEQQMPEVKTLLHELSTALGFDEPALLPETAEPEDIRTDDRPGCKRTTATTVTTEIALQAAGQAGLMVVRRTGTGPVIVEIEPDGHIFRDTPKAEKVLMDFIQRQADRHTAQRRAG